MILTQVTTPLSRFLTCFIVVIVTPSKPCSAHKAPDLDHLQAPIHINLRITAPFLPSSKLHRSHSPQLTKQVSRRTNFPRPRQPRPEKQQRSTSAIMPALIIPNQSIGQGEITQGTSSNIPIGKFAICGVFVIIGSVALIATIALIIKRQRKKRAGKA